MGEIPTASAAQSLSKPPPHPPLRGEVPTLPVWLTGLQLTSFLIHSRSRNPFCVVLSVISRCAGFFFPYGVFSFILNDKWCFLRGGWVESLKNWEIFPLSPFRVKCSGKNCVDVRRIACRTERGMWKGVRLGENKGWELAKRSWELPTVLNKNGQDHATLPTGYRSCESIK